MNSRSHDARTQRLLWALPKPVLCSTAIALGLYSIAGLARSDPPPADISDKVKHDKLFCFRVTDIKRDVTDPNRWQFEFEVVNWTGLNVDGLVLSLNTGGVGTSIGSQPKISGASTDNNGRPIGVGASLPSGNLAPNNNWTAVSTPTKATFTAPVLMPLLRRSATISSVTYDGIRDPDFALLSPSESFKIRDALLAMIPGSVNNGGAGVAGNPYLVGIPNSETIDDATHALDGFVVEIDDYEPGEEMSFNWFFTAGGIPVGNLSHAAPGGVTGDSMGFGTLNFALLGTAANTPAPPPLFPQNAINPVAVNAGYDPPNNSNANADSPLVFAEDQVGGIDNYAMNPIPSGPGAGVTLAVEPGAAVTATFQNPADGFIRGVHVGGGFNLFDPTPYLKFCFGDGSATSCPCGPGLTGSGCPSSIFAGGALLEATGNASIQADTLVLTASNVSGPGLFFQGDGQFVGGLGIMFGDGLLCAGGTILRMGVVFPTGATASYPGGLSPNPIHIAGATAAGHTST